MIKMKYPVQRNRLLRRRKKKRGRKDEGKEKSSRRKRIRKRFRKPIPSIVVPSFFTLMNLFCGFLAVINIFEGRLVFGAWLIVLAGLFDALDGFMARLSNATSEFGIELDSLSDVVSFGVAPGFLIYAFSMQDLQVLGVIVAALPPLCGAVRLARFNVEAHHSAPVDYFRGLPIPAQAVMSASFYLTFYDQLALFEGFEYGVNSVIIPILIVLSFLMVSTVPFDKMPRFSKGALKKNRGKIVLFVLYGIVIAFFQEYGLIAVFSMFILKGLGLAAIQLINTLVEENGSNEDDDEVVVIEEELGN
ncbi:MAG: CDP-diacylglycerol--serine O-phosphatidyltransferase [Bacteroidota bacterium]